MFELDNPYATMSLHLALATLVGGIIGLERSYHGRPAGFRTHALVCTASALLMLVTAYQHLWFHPHELARVTLDPTRMAQGIMTGIGFLGAGVIMKEGLSVRGLTTAASIWMTAAIGILVGIGFYFPAAVAALLTLGTLSVFRKIEQWMPTHSYAEFVVRFATGSRMDEPALRALVKSFHISSENVNYRMRRDNDYFEYQMTIRTLAKKNLNALAEKLSTLPEVSEFRISPTGD